MYKKIKNKVRYYWGKIINMAPLPRRLKWRLGLYNELLFWEGIIKREGLPIYVEEFIGRFDPVLELQSYLAELIENPKGSEIKILDVGAGPQTNLGRYLKGEKIKITAIDPLADKYNCILEKHGVVPSIKTTFGYAEKLSDLFTENYFDLVYASNSLDHCHDPFAAIKQMLVVVKPNCFVYMTHRMNEGEHEKYRGLHQWNLYVKNGDFFINNKNKTIEINVTRELMSVSEMSVTVKEDYITTKIKKLINPS